MELRDYQLEIIDAAIKYLWEHEGNPLVVAPTGTGKTASFNGLVRKIVTEWPGTRVMIVTHVKEIIDQNVKAMLKYWPQAPVGVYSAGMKRKETTKPITYCGIDSVFRRPDEFGTINLLFIDEAHMLSPKQGSKFQKLIAALRTVNPKLRVVGFSATPYRLGQGHLTEDGVFTDVCIDLTTTERFNQFVADGHLCKLVTQATAATVDTSKLHMRCGDFDQHEAEELVNTNELNRDVVREIIRKGHDRNHWLVFAAGKSHALNLTRELKGHGITAEAVFGDTPIEERNSLIGKFKSGNSRAMVVVGIATTGFDFPALDLIAMVRATQSTALWVQCLGRGTRVFPGKETCVVLDFCKNCTRLGPINDPIIPKPKQKGKSGDAPVKICPECNTYNHTRVTICIECGYEFPPSSCIERTAGTEAVMTDQETTPITEEFPVVRTVYRGHISSNGNPCVRISYMTGAKTFDEYLPMGMNDFFRRKVYSWWKFRQGEEPPPESVSDFLERAQDELVPVKNLRVVVNRKYPQIEAVSI